MGPVDAIKTCFRRYFQFSGRAGRAEFWWFYLFSLLGMVGPSLIGYDQLASFFWLATFFPFVAVSCRRLHDCGNSGALILLPFAVQFASVYVFLFAQLTRMMPALATLDMSPETTLGELQERQAAALAEVAFEDFSFADVLPAIIVFALGFAWMAYLLARVSDPGPNTYGPNPREVQL